MIIYLLQCCYKDEMNSSVLRTLSNTQRVFNEGWLLFLLLLFMFNMNFYPKSLFLDPQIFPDGLVVKKLPAMQESWEMCVQSLDWEDPLEEGMATPSNILAWKTLWTEGPDRLQSMGSHRVRHDRSHLARMQSLQMWSLLFYKPKSHFWTLVKDPS